jgi:hypothetical protein
MLLVFGKNAPVLLVLYGDIQGRGVDARALATINALAVLCNAAHSRDVPPVANGHLVRSRAPSSVGSLVSRGLCIFSAGSQFLQRRAASQSIFFSLVVSPTRWTAVHLPGEGTYEHCRTSFDLLRGAACFGRRSWLQSS